MLGIQTVTVTLGKEIVTDILDMRTITVILGIQTTSHTRHRDWDRDCQSRLGIQIATVILGMQAATVVPGIQTAIVILDI